MSTCETDAHATAAENQRDNAIERSTRDPWRRTLLDFDRIRLKFVTPRPVSARCGPEQAIAAAAQSAFDAALRRLASTRLFLGACSCDLLRLLVPEMAVDRAFRQKLVVTIHVDDPAAIDHEDRVRFREHRQPVGDDDDGSSLRHAGADFGG